MLRLYDTVAMREEPRSGISVIDAEDRTRDGTGDRGERRLLKMASVQSVTPTSDSAND